MLRRELGESDLVTGEQYSVIKDHTHARRISFIRRRSLFDIKDVIECTGGGIIRLFKSYMFSPVHGYSGSNLLLIGLANSRIARHNNAWFVCSYTRSPGTGVPDNLTTLIDIVILPIITDGVIRRLNKEI